MTNDPTGKPGIRTPEVYDTPQRPGQSGEQDQQRPGPTPRSIHPTGPHAPYDERDLDGLAAEKHVGGSVPEVAGVPAGKEIKEGNVPLMDVRESKTGF